MNEYTYIIFDHNGRRLGKIGLECATAFHPQKK